MTTEDVIRTAKLAYKLGLTPIPVREDGSKAPVVEEVDRERLLQLVGPELTAQIAGDKPKTKTWKHWQYVRPNKQTMQHLFTNGYRRSGLGLLTGKRLEAFEFDDLETYQVFKETAKAGGLGELIEQIEAGYLEETPGGGIHWLYYCDEVTASTKLATQPDPGDPKKFDTLIETKGEGGFIVIAPSHGPVHETGNAYKLLAGGLEHITEITPDERQELQLLARAFDRSPKHDYEPPIDALPVDGDSPGNDFIRKTTWPELLEPQGWTFVFRRGEKEFWRRPDKNWGVSATINGDGITPDRLYPFTSSTVLEPRRSYTRFQFYAFTEHNGDFQAAARELAREGYGKQEDAIRLLRSVFEEHEPEQPDEDDPENDSPPPKPPWIIDVFELLQEPDEPDVWQVDGLIRHPSVTLIAGPAKTYKSFFAQEMAIAVATGTPMFHEFGTYQPRTVVYIQDESSRRAVRSRFRSLLNGRNMPPVSVREWLYTITNQNFQLDEPEQIKRLIEEAIEVHEPELIILDPLAEMHSANENDSREIRPILRVLKEIRDRYDISIVVLHHNNKNPEYTNPADSIRGSTAIWASMDGGIFLSSTKDENQKKVIVELKEGGQVSPFFFTLDETDDGLTFSTIPVEQVSRRGISDSDIVSCVERLGWSTIDELVNEISVSKRTLQPRLNALAGRGEIQRHEPQFRSQKMLYGPLGKKAPNG